MSPERRAREYEQEADEIDALLAELMVSNSGDERFSSALGKRIGPYLLTAELGRGGMGVVYEAEHTVLRRRVALKMILGAQGKGRGRMLARFEIEARAMARLNHPNILKILDVSVEGQRAYMVTELATAGTLSDRIHREGAMPVEAAIGLCEKLARALHHAHTHAIVHRDVKPANVLFAEDGEPLIADFGLAKPMDDEGSDLSRSGTWLGTPAYMSPEQIAGDSSWIDARADVYSLGATLYEMLTGSYPFRGLGREAFVLAVVNQTPPLVSAVRPDVTRDVSTLVARCLAKAPADRYPSAEALAEDCRRYLASEPILARPVGWLERGRLWRRRRPRASAALITGAAFLLTVAPALVVWQREGLLEQARADARKEAVKKERALAAEAQAYAAQRQSQLQLALGLTLQADLLASGGQRGQALARIQEARRLCEGQGASTLLSDTARWALDRDAPIPLLAFVTAEPSECAAIAPSSRRALLADGKAFGLWDTRTGEQIWSAPAQESPITSLAFSPDGRRALSGERSGGVKLWDLEAHTLLRSLEGHRGEVVAAKFCADGERAVSTAKDETVRLWDLGAGRLVRSFRIGEDGLSTLVVSRAGDLALWCGGGVNGSNVWWNLLTWRTTRARAQPTGLARQAAFSRIGDLAVTGGPKGEITVWETASGRRLSDCAGLKGEVRAVGFSQDDERVIAVDCLGRVLAWKRDTGQRVLDLHLPVDTISRATLSSDGRLLLACDGLGESRLWLLQRGRQLRRIGQSPRGVQALALSADGRLALSAGRDGVARLWSLRSPALLASLGDPGKALNGVDLSQDGRRALTADQDGAVALWDLADGRRLATFTQNSGPARDVVFSGDGQAAVVACRGLPESLLRLNQSGEAANSARAVFPEVARTKLRLLRAVLLPDGTLTLDGDRDGQVEQLRVRSTPLRVWDLDGAGARKVFASGSLYDVARIGDGGLVLTGGQGGFLKVWSLKTGALVRALRAEPKTAGLVRPVSKVLPLPGGKLAFAVHGGVSLWDIERGQRLASWKSEASPVTCVAAARDPAYFFTGHEDGRLRLWQRDRAHPVRSFAGHTGAMTCLVAIPGGDRLLSAGDDGEIRLWDFGQPARRRTLDRDLKGTGGAAGDARGLGRLYALVGYWEWASDLLEVAGPPQGDHETFLAECAWEAGRVGDAERLVLETPPEPAMADVERRLRSAFADRRRRARLAFRAGERQLTAREHTAAVESFGQALNLRPAWALARALRGVARERLGRAQEARADYRRALELDAETSPPKPCPLFFLSRALWRRGRGEVTLALEDVARVVASGLPAQGLRRLRGELELTLGDGEAALSDVAWELARSPRDVGLLTLRVRVLESLGRQRDAVAVLDRLLAGGVKTAALYLQRGRALLSLDDVDLAMSDFSRVLDLRPTFVTRRAHPIVVGYRVADREEIAYRPDFVKTSQHEPRKAGEQVRVASFQFTARETMQLQFCTVEFEDSQQLAQEYVEAYFELARAYGRLARLARTEDERSRDRSRALDALERTIRAGFKEWGRIHTDPDLEPLQGEARYQALMRD